MDDKRKNDFLSYFGLVKKQIKNENSNKSTSSNNCNNTVMLQKTIYSKLPFNVITARKLKTKINNFKLYSKFLGSNYNEYCNKNECMDKINKNNHLSKLKNNYSNNIWFNSFIFYFKL